MVLEGVSSTTRARGLGASTLSSPSSMADTLRGEADAEAVAEAAAEAETEEEAAAAAEEELPSMSLLVDDTAPASVSLAVPAWARGAESEARWTIAGEGMKWLSTGLDRRSAPKMSSTVLTSKGI